jgi:hypothetical protein
MKHLLAALFLAAATQASAAPYAATLTFDDLSGVSTPIPSGYGTLTWTNIFLMPESRLPGSGYDNGNVSAPNSAYAGASNASLARSNGQVFDLQSAYFAKAWHPEVQLPIRYGPYNTLITGYRGSDAAYTAGFNFTNTEPTFVNLGWHDVTKVTFLQNWETVIDNVTVHTAPEPTTYLVMLLAGLGLVAVAVRHSREVSAV